MSTSWYILSVRKSLDNEKNRNKLLPFLTMPILKHGIFRTIHIINVFCHIGIIRESHSTNCLLPLQTCQQFVLHQFRVGDWGSLVGTNTTYYWKNLKFLRPIFCPYAHDVWLSHIFENWQAYVHLVHWVLMRLWRWEREREREILD